MISFRQVIKTIVLTILAILLSLGYASDVFAAEDDIQKEILRYKTMAKANPNNPSVNYRLGALYTSQKDYDLAIKHLKVTIENSEGDYAAMNLLGWCYYRSGNMVDSKLMFEKVLTIEPDNGSAKRGLAKIAAN